MDREETIYRRDVLDLAKKGVLISNGSYKSVCEAINEIPPVNPIESCGNAIDRAEAIKIASGYCHPANVAKELAKLPSVNPQPCEDAISRQAAIDEIRKCRFVVDAIEKIRGLPPVTPHQKIGHWIFVDKAHEHAHCSKCDYGDVDLMDGRPHNFCPNCGARMVDP